jgi:RNA polymerase sigma factor (sigma-70 family)
MVGTVPTAEATQLSTLDAAIAGDAMAFARIVRAYHDDMARVCQVICGDPDLAQDAAQAAWPHAWRRLGTLRDPDKLRSWLITIAANEARRLVRQQRRDRVVPIDTVELGSSAGDPADRVEDADLLQAVRRLPAADREMLALRYVAGFDATEIGAAFGLPSSTVRTRLSRLIARLRQDIGE